MKELIKNIVGFCVVLIGLLAGITQKITHKVVEVAIDKGMMPQKAWQVTKTLALIADRWINQK